MSNQYYTADDVLVEEFYQLPKALIQNEIYDKLSATAKIAYTILKDRHSVSIKNGWVDENGVFFFMSDKELGELLKCSSVQANRIKNDLQKFDLLHMERRGLKKTNILRLIKPKIQAPAKQEPEPLPHADLTKMLNQDITKMLNQDITKMLNKSKNNSSNNNFNNKKEEEEEEKLSHLIDLVEFFSTNISNELTPEYLKKQFTEWLNKLPYEVIKAELTHLAEYGKKPWSYFKNAFKALKDANVTTIEQQQQFHADYKAKIKEKKQKSFKNSPSKQTKVEILPDWFEKSDRNDSGAVAAAGAAADPAENEDEIEKKRQEINNLLASL